MAVETCNVAPISAYTPTNNNPWNAQKVLHLYRRAGFGATTAMIDDALKKTPAQVVDEIVAEATTMNPTPAPIWGYWYKTDMQANDLKLSVVTTQWKNQMVVDCLQNNLRDRLTLFWSNHFVTQETQYLRGAHVFQYYNILQRNAIGNFKDFTREVGTCRAMLEYLNGTENTKESPNENYARELYELFTLGVDNGYTQGDIEETARALTGYNTQTEPWGPYIFDEKDFDNNSKTIFGQEGNWGYDDVIDILFEQRSDTIALFICKKLYTYFVDPIPDTTIIRQLANTFKINDFEIAPVLTRLFRSQHFFDKTTYGVVIKSPMDLLISFIKEAGLEFRDSYPIHTRMKYATAALGQSLLDPIDVKGWQGDTDWIASNTLISRWDYMTTYLRQTFVHDKSIFQTLAINIMEGNATENDPDLISKSIIDHFLPNELSVNGNEYKEGLEIFKDKVPSNYFDDGTWNLNWETVPDQVYNLLNYIITLPEFQLK